MEEFNDTFLITNNYTSVSPTLFSNITNFSIDLTSQFYNATVETFTEILHTESTTLRPANNTIRNITRVGESSPKAVTSSSGSLCTTTVSTTTTEDPTDEFGPPEGLEYIFVPLGVMIFVIILSAVVLIISRKRKLERLRHRLMPLYNFDPGEEGEDDWETELLDEGFTSRQRRQGYQSMDSEENAELFSTAQE